MVSYNRIILIAMTLILTSIYLFNITETSDSSNLLLKKELLNYHDYDDIQIYLRNETENPTVIIRNKEDIQTMIHMIQDLNGYIDESVSNTKEISLLEVYITRKGYNTESPIVVYKDSLMFKNNIRRVDEDKIHNFIKTIRNISNSTFAD